MGTLRVFSSSGDAKVDERADRDPDDPINARTVREWLREGLYLFHDLEERRLNCYCKIADGPQYQLLAEYRADESDSDPVSAFRAAFESVADDRGWTIVEDDTDAASVYRHLGRVSAVEPARPVGDLETEIAERGRVTLRTPDVSTALAVYEHLRRTSDRIGRILVSRSGSTPALPASDVVIVPDGGETIGSVATATGDGVETPVERAADSFEAISAGSDPTSTAERVNPPLHRFGVRLVPEPTDRPTVLPFSLGAVVGLAIGTAFFRPAIPEIGWVGGVAVFASIALVLLAVGTVRGRWRPDAFDTGGTEPAPESLRSFVDAVERIGRSGIALEELLEERVVRDDRFVVRTHGADERRHWIALTGRFVLGVALAVGVLYVLG